MYLEKQWNNKFEGYLLISLWSFLNSSIWNPKSDSWVRKEISKDKQTPQTSLWHSEYSETRLTGGGDTAPGFDG